MGRLAEVNQSTGIGLKLYDGATNQFPRARVYDAAGVEQTGAPWNSPIALTHRANGFYSTSVTPDAEGEFFGVFRVFSDSGFTTLNKKYEEVMEVISVRSVDQDLATLTSRLTAQRATNLDNLDATVSSRESETNALARYNALQADTDDIQARIGTPAGASVSADIAAVKAETAAILDDTGTTGVLIATAEKDDIVDRVWDESLASHIAAGSMGANQNLIDDIEADTSGLRADYTTGRAANLDNLDATVSSREAEADAATRQAALIAEHDATQSAIAGLNDLSAAEVESAVWDAALASHATPGSTGAHQNLLDDIELDTSGLRADYTTLRAANLDNLDTSVSSRESEAAALARATADQNEHDATQALLSSHPSLAQIADAVWDEGLSAHTIPGSAGEKLLAASGITPTIIADAVWNELAATHVAAGTFGDYMAAIRQTVLDNSNDLNDGVDGLAAIRAEVINRASTLTAEIDQNETKIDQIIPAIVTAKGEIISEVDQNQTLISAISPQLTSLQAALKSEIDANEAKLDSLAGAVGAIQNNTTARFIVPERLIKPEAGNKTYQFHLRLFDDLGNPEAPDSTPTIRIRSLESGVDLINGALMTQDGVKVGAYYYSYTISSGTVPFHALVEVTVVENGVTRYIPAVTEISEFEGDLDAIQSQLTAVDTKVTSTQLELANASYGLAALKANQNVIISEVNANEVKIGQVKAKTDLIPASPATEGTLATLNTNILARPLIGDIQTRLNLLGANIKGADNRDITQVYDSIDYSSLLQTSDPRLANLDAPISSRSVLTAAQVWAFGTRELTDHALSSDDVKAIWDYLASQATVAGSLGKRIADFMDASVSSRATAAQVASALAGVAQEATLLGVQSALITEANENELKLNTLQSTASAIKAKTDNLPSNPAQQSSVLSESATIQTAIANLDLKATGIKAKTDTIPISPAKESSVLAIPTNPLLATDARLTNLDAKISTRSVLSAADLGPLAKTSDVTSARTDIINEINQNEVDLDTLLLDVSAIKSKTNNLPVDPASQSRIATAESAILDAIADIPAGGGLTAAQVWSYASRTITQDPNLFKADVSNLATKSDVNAMAKPQYRMRMSTAFNSTTGIQEVLAWAEKDGAVIAATNCTVSVVNSLAVLQWTQTLSSPNGDKVFRFTNAITPAGDQNYYIVITAVVDGQPRTSVESFVTVG